MEGRQRQAGGEERRRPEPSAPTMAALRLLDTAFFQPPDPAHPAPPKPPRRRRGHLLLHARQTASLPAGGAVALLPPVLRHPLPRHHRADHPEELSVMTLARDPCEASVALTTRESSPSTPFHSPVRRRVGRADAGAYGACTLSTTRH